MKRSNSPERLQSQSLGGPPYSMYTDEHESDLEQRESPKPTLSTNRISKSKSHQETWAGAAPHSGTLSSDCNAQLFSSQRHLQEESLDSIIKEFVGQWRQLTRSQLQTISHLREQSSRVRSERTQLKLDFLLALWETEALRFKLHNVRLNVEVLHVQLETKPSTDRNRLLVLELLQKKLAKKLFFAGLRFNWLLRRVRKMDQQYPAKSTFRGQHKIIQTELVHAVLGRIVKARLAGALGCIKKSVFLDNLFSPGNSQDSDQEIEHQRQSPSPLQLTLSPNYPGTAKKSGGNPFSFFKEQPVIVPQKETVEQSEIASSRFPISTEPIASRQISELHRLINNLEGDIRRCQGHFREDRQAKQRELYFNRWKVAFLKKHLQAVAQQHYHSKLAKRYFQAWRQLQLSNNQKQFIRVEDADIEAAPNKQSFLAETLELRSLVKERRFHEFMQLVGNLKDARKIYEVCRQIYRKNLKIKALYGLATRARRNQPQPSTEHVDGLKQPVYQQDSRTEESDIGRSYHGTPQELAEDAGNEVYSEDISQQSSARELSSSFRNNTLEEESSSSQLTAELFRRGNLLTKAFVNMKKYCRLRRGSRLLSKVFKRKAIDRIQEVGYYQDRLNDRLDRYLKQKQLSLQFKCFMVLRRGVFGKPGRPSIQHIVRAKNRAISEKYFSVLKLLWKMKLVRQRKADRLRQLHCGFRAFAALKEYAKSQAFINGKNRQLRSLLYNRRSTTFLRNLLRNYLSAQQLARKTEGLRNWIFERQTERICSMLQLWKHKVVVRKSFDRVEDRLRRLRQTETKRRIFEGWWQQVYGTPRLPFQSQTGVTPATQPPSPSGEHRYWLERYYSKLLEQSDSTAH